VHPEAEGKPLSVPQGEGLAVMEGERLPEEDPAGRVGEGEALELAQAEGLLPGEEDGEKLEDGELEALLLKKLGEVEGEGGADKDPLGVVMREKEGLREAVAPKLGLCEGEAEMDIEEYELGLCEGEEEMDMEEDVVAEHEGSLGRPSIGQEEGHLQGMGTTVPSGQ
jgi:hypothetical protein